MGLRRKVLLYEKMHGAGTGLLEESCELVYATSLDEESLLGQVADIEAIVIRANGNVTRRIMEAAPRLKAIGRHGVGLENIDLRAAKERGIRVLYTPAANAQSVAEHFVGLAIMLAKRLRSADRSLGQGHWKARFELTGTELFGKTLGVLGFGRVGQQTARICHNGFGMPVLYYDVVGFPDMEKALNARRTELEQLFREADFISINLPLLPQTKGLVNAALLRIMKPTAFILNMARGSVWVESDVVKALREKWIAGVGSDVFEAEPSPADHALFTLDNFVGTPHMAAHTEEGLIRMSLVARDIVRVLDGQEPQYPVPEEVFRLYS
jgi:D-3-phosphoglycerate dehydrogenase